MFIGAGGGGGGVWVATGAAGATVVLASGIFIFPEICGQSSLRNIDGKSFVKLVQRGDPSWRKSWFYYYNYEKQFPYTPNVRGVRTDDWKLIHYPNGDGKPDRFTAELYDLKNDPHEMRNLIADPGHAARRAALERELARVSKAAGLDKMPVYEGITNVLPKY